MPTSRDRVYILLFALAVGILGLLPHLALSLLVGKVVFCESAYDEYYHWLYSFQGPARMDRQIAQILFRLFYKCSPGVDFGMIVMDFLMPFLVALAAAALVWTCKIEGRPRKLVAALALLFGQELLSLGCNAIWSAPMIMSYWHPKLPEAAQAMVPFYYTSFYMLYRTAEPQTSLVFFFGTMAWFSYLLKHSPNGPSGRQQVLLWLLMAAIPFEYIFVGLSSLVFFGTFTLTALLTGQRGWAKTALVCSLLAAAGLALSLVATQQSDTSGFNLEFASRLPMFGPSMLLSAWVFLGFRKSVPSAQKAASMAACALPWILLNQQVITGRMVSGRHWEYSLNFTFCVLAALWSELPFTQKWGKKSLAVLCLALLYGQCRVCGIWYKANARVLAIESLLARNWKGEDILLETSIDGSSVQARSGVRYPWIVDYTEAYRHPVAQLSDPNSLPSSQNSQRAYRAWERFGYDGAKLKHLLEEERAQRSMFWLPFFFSMHDCISHITDHRNFRPAVLEKLCPLIEAEYQAYLKSDHDHAPILLVTTTEPAQNPKFDYQLLDKVEYPRMRVFLYRQILK